jgi:hypothetical protein
VIVSRLFAFVALVPFVTSVLPVRSIAQQPSASSAHANGKENVLDPSWWLHISPQELNSKAGAAYPDWLMSPSSGTVTGKKVIPFTEWQPPLTSGVGVSKWSTPQGWKVPTTDPKLFPVPFGMLMVEMPTPCDKLFKDLPEPPDCALINTLSPQSPPSKPSAGKTKPPNTNVPAVGP